MLKIEALHVLFIVIFFFNNIALAKTYWVSVHGNDSHAGSKIKPWATLQHASGKVLKGDVVVVETGKYAGFRTKSDGESETPIVFKAAPGATVIINSLGPESRHGSLINIENNNHWVIDGLTVTGAPKTAGIDIRHANHVTVQNCHLYKNRRWGIFTSFADYFVAEKNECSFSIEEHGIYHSNSGDNAIIRYNYCHNNYVCGIQINADPSMGGDGISTQCIVSSNILHDNGSGGGAAINLASVRNSLIVNNLIYNNFAGGIAAWDDAQGHQWGSKFNKFYHNTVHMPGGSRWALNLGNGSTGSIIRNNILIHDNEQQGGLQIDLSSYPSTTSDYNIVGSIKLNEKIYSLNQWRAQTYQDLHSNNEDANLLFKIPQTDYRLLGKSIALDSGIPLTEVKYDITGSQRKSALKVDIGAFESREDSFGN